MTTKTCTKCGRELPATKEYYPRKSESRDGFQSSCKDCQSEYNQRPERKAANRKYQCKHVQCPGVKEANRERRLARKFGLTVSQYEGLAAAQGGICPITLEPFDLAGMNGKRPHVDHDHETGAVRGILSDRANVAIGMLHDDPAALRRAADYLESRHRR